MKEVLNIIWPIITLIIGIAIGCLLNLSSCKKQNSKIEYVPIHDTITIESERIIEHTKVKYVKDTLIQVDSFYIKGDTVYVAVPMEFLQYSDTIKTDSTSTTIDVYHHGIKSQIDSIKFDYQYFKENQIIIKEPKRVGIMWYIGPSIGYGGFVNAQNGGFNHGPFIGISGGIGFGGYIKK